MKRSLPFVFITLFAVAAVVFGVLYTSDHTSKTAEIEEMKETAANRDVNAGSVSNGVTAASAIAVAGIAGPPNVRRTQSANDGTNSTTSPKSVPERMDAYAPCHVARRQKRPSSIVTPTPGSREPTTFWKYAITSPTKSVMTNAIASATRRAMRLANA